MLPPRNPLLASIETFSHSKLADVEESHPSPEPKPDARKSMLSMISGFNKNRLKKADSAPKTPPARTITSEETSSIADMLRSRMAGLRADIIDEESEEEEEDDDDWSDDDY